MDHLNFIGNLGAAQHSDEWPVRLFQSHAQVAQLLFHQQAGARLLHKFCDSHHGSVRAMGRPEGVANIQAVAQGGQAARKFLVVGFLFFVEPQILQQQHAAFGESFAFSFGLRPYAIERKFDGTVYQLLELLGHRTH